MERKHTLRPIRPYIFVLLLPIARRLYERIGFQSWGCEPRALCCSGRYADDIHMLLDLHQL